MLPFNGDFVLLATLQMVPLRNPGDGSEPISVVIQGALEIYRNIHALVDNSRFIFLFGGTPFVGCGFDKRQRTP